MRTHDIDDMLADWLAVDAQDPAPAGLLEQIASSTVQRRPRPGWLANLRGHWVGSDVRLVAGQTPDPDDERRSPMTVILQPLRTRPQLRAPWVLILAAILGLSLAGASLVVGARLLTPAQPDLGPLAVVMPPTACPDGTVLKSGDIATIAGTGARGRSVDGGAATSAVLAHPRAIAVDESGTVYFTDSTPIVQRIGADGTLSAYGGNGMGDPFIGPSGLAVGADGNLYVSDDSVNQVFRIDPGGSVTVIAGTGRHTRPSMGNVEPGDEGAAVAAELWTKGVSVDPAGAIYIDGWGRYRKIDTKGVMHAFAGTGTTGWTGDGGPATAATFGGGPDAPAADRYGNVYLNDPGNLRIRRVDASGIITTVAGNGDSLPSGDGGPAVEAGIGSPTALAVDEAGDLFLATAGSVRMVDAAGIIRTIAGAGGYRSGLLRGLRSRRRGPAHDRGWLGGP